jgi:hypothetical protein
MTSIISTEKLTKAYGSRSGIVDVNLEVVEGEVFGFLGPNGAGKTTTIRTLLDLIRPTSGRAFIFGIESTADPVAIHRRIGYLPGEFTRLTGGQTIQYYLLGDGDQAQVVLAGAPRHGGDERAALGKAQQRPGLVNHKQARPSVAPRARPDPAGDQVDGQRPQLVFELLDVEHHQPAVQLHVRWTGEQPRAERPRYVAS